MRNRFLYVNINQYIKEKEKEKCYKSNREKKENFFVRKDNKCTLILFHFFFYTFDKN